MSIYRAEELAAGAPIPFDLRGAITSYLCTGAGEWRVLRDPLGLNKLFWVSESHGTWYLSARPHRLVAAGFNFDDIRAVPRGCVFDHRQGESGARKASILPPRWKVAASSTDAPPIVEIGAEIRSSVERYLAAIAAAHPTARVFVCCSGGLDSSGIVALVAQHFADVVAVSFDLSRAEGRVSQDRRMAERLCNDLGLPLLDVTVSPEQLLEHLDTVLMEGIDWRDFNVHAGLVNAVIAEAIVDAHAKQTIVFTGDLANEFLADYHEESYLGESYYRLPHLPLDELRASLVQGLDTSNREIGVFAAWGLPVVQPYAVAIDSYLRLPSSFFGLRDAKQQLCSSIFGELVPGFIYDRPKVRAQIGDADASGGVLATCIDHGLNQDRLRERFARLHGVSDHRELNRFMRAGRYRSAVPTTEEGLL
ncbi:MAG: asparagine synthase-related protein [Pseudonocardiaceae bacterium]